MKLAKANKLQQQAILRKWQQNSQGLSYRQFRRTVQQSFDCLMVRWSGMWLGIEIDGYTHS